MAKTCFIGNVYPNELADYYLKLGKTSFSSTIFNKTIISSAFDLIDNFTVLSCPSIGRFPFSTKTMRAKTFKISDNYICLGHSNLAYFDVYSSANTIYSEFKKRYKKDEEINVIVSEAGLSYLLALKKIKKHYKKIKSILIVFDLPENVKNRKRTPLYSFLKNHSIKKANKLYRIFDSFIFLAEVMNKKVNKLNKPYIVFPCIVELDAYKGVKKEINDSDKIIVTYSGELNYKYNINLLFDAFELLDQKKFCLQIIGDGDYKNEIVNKVNNSSSIRYLGLVTPDKALYYQLNSSVLVNPRLPNDQYSNESFPSKTVSYLLSCNPVVSYIFQSTPKDIASILIVPKGFDSKSLATAIEEASKRKANKEQINSILGKYSSKKFVLAILKLLNN